VRGTNPSGEGEANAEEEGRGGDRGDGTGDVTSSERGVSLMPIIIWAGERVGWISAPAWKEEGGQFRKSTLKLSKVAGWEEGKAGNSTHCSQSNSTHTLPHSIRIQKPQFPTRQRPSPLLLSL
jgi:hypothetical protein